MPKFRKLPVVIEAEQYFPGKNIEGVFDANVTGCGHSTRRGPHCHTLEGPLNIQDGDWIIKGVNGEFYPCKPDIFELTYEKVEE